MPSDTQRWLRIVRAAVKQTVGENYSVQFTESKDKPASVSVTFTATEQEHKRIGFKPC